jgi:L-asparaginase II
MRFEPLIDIVRGGHGVNISESLHYGAVAVTNDQGKLLASVGDPTQRVFSRSSLKPFQAIPLLMNAKHDTFNFTGQHIALMCASHSAEPFHVDAVQTMLDTIDLPRTKLMCGCHAPYFYTFFGRSPPDDAVWDERHSNCSGKHTGMLASCLVNGWSPDDYINPQHPLQRAIAQALSTMTGLAASDIPAGIDGCSAPAFALPLQSCATLFAKLAVDRDGPYAASLARTCDAMIAHPEYVSGTNRNDEAFMRIGRGDWVSKVGADGIQTIASKSRREGIALKVADGNGDMRYATTVEVMEQLGWLDDAQRTQLEPWRFRTMINVAGRVVGERKPVFRLR